MKLFNKHQSLRARRSKPRLLAGIASSLTLLAMTIKRIVKSQGGQALPMALILLLLGGFLVVPSLVLMTTSLTATRLVDRANLELYAADAGVEEVMWHLNYDDTPGFLPTGTGEQTVPLVQTKINGKDIVATISKQGEVYRITSTATSTDGHRTKIECFVDAGSKYSFLLDNAITSAGSVNIQPGATVNGEVVYGNVNGCDNKGTINDPPPNGDGDGQGEYDSTLKTRWPTELELNTFYDVDNQTKLPLFSANKIDLKDYSGPIVDIGPFRRNGDLTIDNSGASGKTLRLNGTIYITGNLTFAQTGVKDYTFNLNGKTIYVKGNITWAADKVPIIGSGCIVAVGTINLTPKTICSLPDEFVLILSVTKSTTLKPNGDFYGSVAGFTDVTLQPGNCITELPPENLNFPGMGGGAGGGLGGKAKLLTYTIIKIP